MKNVIAAISLSIVAWSAEAQSSATSPTVVKKAIYTPVKSQDNTGTCWSFSTTSLIESQTIKNGYGDVDISEMFTVRNIYVEKAKNYVLRQGAAQFGPGGLGHDVTRAIGRYGAIPESIYTGLPLGQKNHDHSKLDARLKAYLDSLLKVRPLPDKWLAGYEGVLDEMLGKVPQTFTYGERRYTPLSFAAEVLHYNTYDYVNITSYSHHPFYKAFVLEAPDNFLNGAYYNVPIDEMIKLTEQALTAGYSLMWDADVSNPNFRQKEGYALLWKGTVPNPINADDIESGYDQKTRQALYENLTTQDDHLMHLVGIEKSANGKKFFLVKNSWGEIGPFKGFIHVSEAYFAINTVSLVIPKAALDRAMLTKLGFE